MRRLTTAAAVAFLCALADPAPAQSDGTVAPGSDAAVPEKTAPGTAPRTNLDQKAGTLSDKLSETNGVIKPTGDVDPDMHVPSPQSGTTPVIKPGDIGGGTAK